MRRHLTQTPVQPLTAVPYYYFRVPVEAIHSKTPIFLKQRFYFKKKKNYVIKKAF
jgi:hypothetical protein